MKRIIFFAWIGLMALSAGSCSKTKKLAKQHHSDLEQTYKELKQDMPDASVTLEGEKVKVVLPEAVLFRINSADMNESYLPILSKMARVLNKYEQTSILITGYTDSTGGESYNMDLSRRRADAAKAILVKDKVRTSRIFTWGMGAQNPIGDNGTLEGRKQNRRVEYVIMYDYKGQKE